MSSASISGNMYNQDVLKYQRFRLAEVACLIYRCCFSVVDFLIGLMTIIVIMMKMMMIFPGRVIPVTEKTAQTDPPLKYSACYNG